MKPEKTEQENKKRLSLMQIEAKPWVKILITVGVMAILIILVILFNIPNPNMILIAGLVLCSALFGYAGGIIAGTIMLFYTLYFFSTDHSFIHFTSQNVQKVVVSLVGISTDMILVCALKQAELNAFKNVNELTEELRRENEVLQSMSLTDGLTGLRNRMALRKDYDSYTGRDVTVMMLDLDRFKSINDTQGHKAGDKALAETGALLLKHFGSDFCYRYGGDEFLVIYPDKTEQEFKEKLDLMMTERPQLTAEKQPPVIFRRIRVRKRQRSVHAARYVCRGGRKDVRKQTCKAYRRIILNAIYLLLPPYTAFLRKTPFSGAGSI